MQRKNNLISKVLRKFKAIIEYIISFPISVLLYLMFPIYKIKLVKLFSDRIGHYALNTELMLCTIDQNRPLKREKYFYYTCSSLTPICNIQLHLMWKRILPILPFPGIAFKIDKILSLLLGNKYKKDKIKAIFELTSGVNDINGLLEKTTHPHLSFTQEENTQCEILLAKLNIPLDARIVCLIVRDANYLKQYLPGLDWSHHAFRNSSIENYEKTALFLAEKGYYIVRMGKYVAKEFQITHRRIIDYANHPLRSDLMDIYLSSRCCFFISTVTGLDCVPQIFRKPGVFTNVVLPSELLTWYPNILFIPKMVINKKNNEILNFKEMDKTIYSHWPKLTMIDILRNNELDVIENSPDDILSVVEEAEARITNHWVETEEDKQTQHQFWESFPSSLKDQEGYPMYAKNIKIKIGSHFLKKYVSLFN